MKKLFLISCALLCIATACNQKENPSVYKTGKAEIILLAEMQNEASKDILIGASEEMINECLSSTHTCPMAINAFLVKMNKKNYLVDAGLGINLLANLAAASVTPAEIDAIFITHMHSDHVWGMLSDSGVVFKNATIYIPKVEYDYWMSDDEMIAAGEEQAAKGFATARTVIEAYKNQITTISTKEIGEGGEEIIPGIAAISAYGHTPGHSMFMIDKKVLVWGDLAHAMDIQMPYPQVAVTYDVSPEMAIESREKVLKHIADTDILVAGMHIAYPSLGKIKKSEKAGYIFEARK